MKLYFSETLSIDKFEGVHLLQDHIGTNYHAPWDDFGFVITFQVWYVNEKKNKNRLGNIKLLSKNTNDTSTLLKNKKFVVSEKIYDISNILNPDNFISIGEDINYYKIINSIYISPINEKYLELVCDIGYYHNNIEKYQTWDGYDGSFMRGSSSDAILKKGFQTALGRYKANKNFKLKIDNLGDTFEPITFNFDERKIGKSNICLLIGKNGVGKSHLLKEICHIITGLNNNNSEIPAFNKLIVIAYSPFESFFSYKQIFDLINQKFSQENTKSNRKSLERKRLHINEYCYIGFKNEEGVFDLNYPAMRSITSILKIIKYDQDNNWWKEEKTRLTILKETLKLCMDFDDIYIKTSDNNEIIISDDLRLKKIKDFEIDYSTGLIFKKGEKNINLSSGQKIYSYILPAIMSEIEEESLLIIDEPELYLHPELEVNLINMIKNILNETDSYSIIATHSSIIAREVGRESINILRKEDNITKSYLASIETYGESIENIISEIFDDNYIKKPFQNEIDKFINSENFSLDIAKKLIGNEALIHILTQKKN
ncbi:TPA: ATP-binding protein [Acinetobacter nosocomialis]|nr:ATP-binding protein [Acinetobacter nosocomialis]